MASSGRSPERVQEDYRATVDSVARSAEHVRELEAAKAELAPSDPRTRELTDAVETEVDEMERDAEAQEALVDEAGGEEPSRNN
jgi:hypothetical protein